MVGRKFGCRSGAAPAKLGAQVAVTASGSSSRDVQLRAPKFAVTIVTSAPL